MHQTTKALSEQAVQLPPTERMALVARILDSLDQPDTTMDALWASEAADRLAAYRRGEIKAVALSDVISKYTMSAPELQMFSHLSYAACHAYPSVVFDS